MRCEVRGVWTVSRGPTLVVANENFIKDEWCKFSRSETIEWIVLRVFDNVTD